MDIDRRTVLATGGVVVAGAVVAACSSETAAPGAAATGGPGAAANPPASASPVAGAVAQAADIPVGGGLVLDGPAVVITQPAAGDIRAFTAICPHQGCLVTEVVDNEIICACHGSRFSASDGAVLAGPAQQGLAPAGVALEGGSVVLG